MAGYDKAWAFKTFKALRREREWRYAGDAIDKMREICAQKVSVGLARREEMWLQATPLPSLPRKTVTR